MKEARKTCITGKLPPPVGTSEWETFSQDSLCVDKTRMIKEIVDLKTRVALFTRPRRFGKTTALKMIRAFFERRVDEKGEQVDTSYLFKDKKIWAAGETCRRLQGQFPVVWLSFKGHKATNWEDAFEVMMRDVGAEISRHWVSVESGWGDGPLKEQKRRIVNRTASFVDLTASLGYLALAHPVLSVSSPVGFVTVVGFVLRNGILLLQRYREGVADGLSVEQAIREGSMERMVPIILTSLATVLGLVPIVLAGMTPGGELLAPLAVVQFGGILGATVLNLVVMPAAAKLVIRSGREA